MKIARLKIIFHLLCFALVQPAISHAFIISDVAVQDTTRPDSASIMPDSILKKIPQRIFSEDTTFQQYHGSPWQMSKATMNQYFYEDLGDLLNYFPGIYLLDLGSSGQKLSLSRHGANEKQTTLFFDEHPFYDPIHGGIDLNLIPVGFTKTITLEQGVSSPLITANAERVSLSSQDYEAAEPYSQVSYHKAPYGFSDIDVIFGRKVSNKTKLILGGIIKSYDGKTTAYGFEQQNFRGKVVYQLTPAWQFKYSWLSNKINRQVPNPILADPSYQPTDATEKASRLDQTLDIKGSIFKSDFHNFKASLFYSSLSDKIKDKNFSLHLNNPSRYAGFNLQIQHRLLGQKLTSGTDLTHEWTDADQVGNNKQTFGSLFIQDDWQWKHRWGMRILGDYKLHSAHSSQLTGGLSNFFSVAKNAKITASARQAIRYPTFFEMNAKTNFIGNPNLKPELHQTIELGVAWEIEPKFSLRSTLYHRNIQHGIQFNPLDSLKATFLNQNEIQYSGFDVQLKWNFLSKFQLMALVSKIDNSRLTDQPDIMLTGYLQYSNSFFQGDARPTIRLEGRYVGERRSLITHPYLDESFQKDFDPAVILNAHALLDFGNLKIFITLENILDKQYQLLYGYPLNKRTLHYGLRWEFWN